jgi:hypothetical protein
VFLIFYRREVAEKFFEHNEESNRVDFFTQTAVHIVNQKTHPGVTPCKCQLREKVLIAHPSVNVPHRTLMGHSPHE